MTGMSTSTVTFISVSGTSFSSGDSMFVDFWFTYTSPYTDRLIIGIHGEAENDYYELFNQTASEVIKIKRVGTGVESRYRVGLKIPESALTDTYELVIYNSDGPINTTISVQNNQVVPNDPHITIVSMGALPTYKDSIFSMSISINFTPSDKDTLVVTIGGLQVYKGPYQQTVSFTVPTLAEGTYNMTLTGTSEVKLFEVQKKEETTTGIILPSQVEKYSTVHYYTIEGVEKIKPTEGLYIWKADCGESGKVILHR